MKLIFSLLLLTAALKSFSQIDSSFYRDESILFWDEQDAHYRDKEKSPLNKKARKAFTGHRHYDFDITYVVTAAFQRLVNGDTVVMQTSADTEKKYIKYAQLHFNIGSSHCHLFAYQSLALRETEEYKNYLFIPFKDLTSGNQTYGGGRYLDILIPESNQVVINFNKAYNPYCAYTDGYFCPIPPAENTLTVAINAGAMTPAHLHD